jgi:hypothetical protein
VFAADRGGAHYLSVRQQPSLQVAKVKPSVDSGEQDFLLNRDDVRSDERTWLAEVGGEHKHTTVAGASLRRTPAPIARPVNLQGHS